MGRAPQWAAVASMAMLLIACSTGSSGKAAPTTTTLGPPRPSTSITTTTLGKTNDPAFHTRRAGVLTVATDHLEAPYFVIDPATGSVTAGYEYDIARVLATRLGLGRIRVVRASLDAIARNYDCGCDVFLGGVPVSDDLARKVDLSTPYVAASPAVLMKAGSAAPTTTTARSLRWGYVNEDAQAISTVNERIRPVVTPRVLAQDSDLVRAVAAGEVDAGLLPAPAALLAAKSDPTLTVVAQYDDRGQWAAVENLGSANSPSLNDLMEKLADDGTFAFINRLHLGMDPAKIPPMADG